MTRIRNHHEHGQARKMGFFQGTGGVCAFRTMRPRVARMMPRNEVCFLSKSSVSHTQPGMTGSFPHHHPSQTRR